MRQLEILCLHSATEHQLELQCFGDNGKTNTSVTLQAPRQDGNEIPTATPMFSGTRNPTVLLGMLCDVRSQNSKMAASNLEIYLD